MVCGGAHALHDGYTDLLGILLPLLQAQFALSYTFIGSLRTVYSIAMAGGQIPAGLLAERIGGRVLLALGTALAALGDALGLPLMIALLAVSALTTIPLAVLLRPALGRGLGP